MSYNILMNYKGVIIEESLDNKDVLKNVSVLKTEIETVTEEHKTPWIKKWTLHSVEIPNATADEISKKISQSLEKEHNWYADFKNDLYHYIIYQNKVFKVDLKNPVLYRDAKEYGISIGIPEYQVDFAPEDKVWER